jgi:hypothetical protein
MSRKNQSYCLSPHLAPGKANRPVTTIHLHSDGSWWFWQDDGMIEQGPFVSQALAQESYQSFSGRIEKPVVRKYDLKWTLIGLLAVLIYWLHFGRHR